MKWVYKSQIMNTLSIPFYASGSVATYDVRLVADDMELEKAYLCMLQADFVSFVQAKIKDSSKWYDVGGIYDTDCFIGTVKQGSFVDLTIQIALPATIDSGVYRIPFVALHGEQPHGPNRNFCAYGDDAPLWGDNDLDTPLWTSTEGRCPFSEGAGSCETEYGAAVPSETLPLYSPVVTYLDDDVVMMKVADTDTAQNASVVGIMVDEAILMPQAVGGAQFWDGGQYIYEQGGQGVTIDGELDPDTWYPEIRVFDTERLIWLQLGSCGPAQARNNSITVVNDVLYIYGGDNGQGTYYSSLYAFDLNELTCTQLADAPAALSGANMLNLDPDIHVIDGWDAAGPNAGYVYIYNIDTDTWTTYGLPEEEQPPPSIYPFVGFPSGWSALPNVAQFSPILAGCSGGRYFMWFDQGEGLAGGYVYPNWQKGWESLGDPQTLPAYGGAYSHDILNGVGYSGKLYFCNPWYEPTVMAVYDVAGNSWSTGATSPAVADSGDPVNAGLYGTKVYHWGVNSDGKAQFVVYDADTDTWDPVIHVSSTAVDWAVGSILGNKLYSFGSHDTGGVTYFDVYSTNLDTFVTTHTQFTAPWGLSQDYRLDNAVSVDGKIFFQLYPIPPM